jgi:hypothetical protein
LEEIIWGVKNLGCRVGVCSWNVRVGSFRGRDCRGVGDSGLQGSWNTRVGGFREKHYINGGEVHLSPSEGGLGYIENGHGHIGGCTI